jgi:general transcription factor 3C polypeptide 3 (transcription factor C subunit 4)
MELNYQQSLAASTLREAFDYHIERFNGEGENPKDEPNTMHLGNIVALTDLLLQLDKLEEGLVVVKRGQRWLQGRRDQRSWDSIDDDREYDPQGSAREAEGEDMEGFEGFALDTALRHRLALIRLRLGDDDEAMVRRPLLRGH